MAQRKRGLRVKHCENVASYTKSKMGNTLKAVIPSGWFIQVWYGKAWHSLMDLRFVRERDAARAVQSLTAAGLDTHDKLSAADPIAVKQVAVEHLQW